MFELILVGVVGLVVGGTLGVFVGFKVGQIAGLAKVIGLWK